MDGRRRIARLAGGPPRPLVFSRVVASSLLIAAALAVACATPQAEKKAKPASVTPVPYQLIAHPVDRAALSPVERRGYDLYVRDLAASRATNATLTEIAKLRLGEITGWIVVPYEQGFLTRFLTKDAKSVVDVSVDPTSALAPYVVVHDPAVAISDREAAMWRARELARQFAIEKPIPSCADRYDTIVVPESDRDDSDWLVYLIAIPSEPNRFAVGGHHRIRIDAAGGRVLEHFALSKGCLSPEYDPASPGLVVTHLVSSEPVESHVYLSLLHGITLYVGVAEPRRTWKVEGGRVQAVD